MALKFANLQYQEEEEDKDDEEEEEEKYHGKLCHPKLDAFLLVRGIMDNGTCYPMHLDSTQVYLIPVQVLTMESSVVADFCCNCCSSDWE